MDCFDQFCDINSGHGAQEEEDDDDFDNRDASNYAQLLQSA